ncbi:hypothetical protein amb2185 [Paramagnetospirillum magneticum AMB-1]|uniref:Uncharacterized protein n=1 Tax=Paramagnetospirillum magneticum (strain ATCC 700264 / AMB-1) TaxID=342108 RepID=Q2W586_PARM1|nr:hypothetical protein amb2185 [Paramagnetospirillum magneticum AMB-1]
MAGLVGAPPDQTEESKIKKFSFVSLISPASIRNNPITPTFFGRIKGCI